MHHLSTKHSPGIYNNYALSGCQVATPPHVVKGIWRIVAGYRARIGKVVDFGAGDGRFALEGSYESYLGIEIDGHCKKHDGLPKNAHIRTACAFEFKGGDFDLCIGNPPYIRHHNVDKTWLRKIREEIKEGLDESISLQANLYLYFMCLAILKTREEGLIALVVPFEWTTRPSSSGLRCILRRNRWNVDVFRLSDEVFEGVLTTACVVIVDKARSNNRWRFFDIGSDWNARPRKGPTGSGEEPLQHEKRGQIWAMRGLSPGTQKVFTLSEGDRIHNGLLIQDVLPCITTLRPIPRDCQVLDGRTFRKYYVKAGEKCWLIKSCITPSSRLSQYLGAVPESLRNTKTCSRRSPWYLYRSHPIPKVLYSAGFVAYGPKSVVNRIRATPVGSVQGVYSMTRFGLSALVEYLHSINFERRIVAHAKTLKKVEVKQMNSILNGYLSWKAKNG